MSARILKTVREVKAFSDELKRQGRSLALVPTMGFLHEGHLSLMREGKRRADLVAVSIFVNPTQFAPTEDLSRYPRDFEGDRAKCESAGADVIFAPSPEEIYPPGFQTYVQVEQVSQGLCGASRPTHFKGVATVVTKLLSLFRPDVALFGEKDYQQLQVISALNRDLNLGVDVVGMPIIREADGLAMSSRNAYLSADERRRALSLSRGLKAAQALAKKSPHIDTAALKQVVRQELLQDQVREDYVEVVDAVTLVPLSSLETGRAARILVAGFLGTTRLIDNAGLPG